MCFSAAMVGLFLVLAVHLQAGVGFSPWESGLALAPFSVGSFLGTGVSVPLGSRLGKALCGAGALLMAAGTWWTTVVAQSSGTSLTWPNLAGPLAGAGLGLGLHVVPLIDIALAEVPLRDAGAASGAFSTIQQIGSALGVALLGLVFFGAAAAAGFLVCAAASLLLPPVSSVRSHQESADATPAEQEQPIG
jgi:hypothetical protein